MSFYWSFGRATSFEVSRYAVGWMVITTTLGFTAIKLFAPNVNEHISTAHANGRQFFQVKKQ